MYATDEGIHRRKNVFRPGKLIGGDAAGVMKESAVRRIKPVNVAAKWQEMSRAGAADARQRFAMDDIVERYEQLYLQTTA